MVYWFFVQIEKICWCTNALRQLLFWPMNQFTIFDPTSKKPTTSKRCLLYFLCYKNGFLWKAFFAFIFLFFVILCILDNISFPNIYLLLQGRLDEAKKCSRPFLLIHSLYLKTGFNICQQKIYDVLHRLNNSFRNNLIYFCLHIIKRITRPINNIYFRNYCNNLFLYCIHVIFFVTILAILIWNMIL